MIMITARFPKFLAHIFFGVCIIFSALLVLPFVGQEKVYSQDDCTCQAGQNDVDCNKQKISCLQGKIDQKKQAANTLSNTISILNGQIVVQELQVQQTKNEIDQLEKEINDLSVRISGLNTSLDSLTTVLIERTRENYKRGQTNPLNILLISNTVDNFLLKYKYVRVAQQHTQDLMKKAESQRISFDEQKVLKEKKQLEVDRKRQMLQKQEADLSRERAAQQSLLTDTRNDEARYQAELAKTLAEQQAIESLIAGNGDEQQVRDVQQGETIASIIPGPSACSTGAHLHFEVVKDGLNHDPANFLKPLGDIIWNNAPDDPFGFAGNWDWPLNNAAKINQGYGMTWYARVRRAYGGAPHTGIDMISKSEGDYTVKAVKSGVLYRGSIHCGSGRLRYVKVAHKDEGYNTFYLHVNY